MPFTEREDEHEPEFFKKVLEKSFEPPARAAGFRLTATLQQGSDLNHSTIVKACLLPTSTEA